MSSRSSLALPGGTLPGPQEVETSLAEGTARFFWTNAVAYDKILVLSPTGEVLHELLGGETSLELPVVAGTTRLDISLQGVMTQADSTRVDAVAKIHRKLQFRREGYLKRMHRILDGENR